MVWMDWVMFALGMAAGWGCALLFNFLSDGLQMEKQIMMNEPPKLKKARKPRDPNKPVKARVKKVPLDGVVQGTAVQGYVGPANTHGQMAYNGADTYQTPVSVSPSEQVGRPLEPIVRVNGETQWPAN